MFKSGYIAIVGQPNVGKSTLLNHVLGEKLAAVTPKAQTTRHRILGIKHLSNAQLLFLDTPGIHSDKKRINQSMVDKIFASMDEADVILHLIKPRVPAALQDVRIYEYAKKLGKPYILAINQIDQIAKFNLLPIMEYYHKQWQLAEIVPIAALHDDGLESLCKVICKYLPEGPAYFSTDQSTDVSWKFVLSEIIREKATLLLHKEIPYSLTVDVEKIDDQEKMTTIHASIVVERDSQKAIVLGKRGEMLRRIGSNARFEIEKNYGKKVLLKLFVKVNKNWTENPRHLLEYGIS